MLYFGKQSFFVLFHRKEQQRPKTWRKVGLLAPCSALCCSKSATLGVICFDLILFHKVGEREKQAEYGLTWGFDELKPLMQSSPSLVRLMGTATIAALKVPAYLLYEHNTWSNSVNFPPNHSFSSSESYCFSWRLDL